MNKPIKEELESVFRDLSITVIEDTRITVTAKKGQVLALLAFLKDKGFDHLTLLSCVDWMEENEFELVYILAPYMQSNEEYTDRERTHLIAKTRISREKPRFETVTRIFPNAEPYEREIHELFGIDFEGHKRLTPLFLERDYQTPPFRKDFDSRKYVEEVFDKIPLVQDNDE